MTRPYSRTMAAGRKAIAAIAVVVAVSVLSGCHYSLPFLSRNDFGHPLPADASKEEIIGRVNDNIAKVSSWRSHKVYISGGAMPLRVGAQIAVEAPRNFRLMAGVLGSEQADFGSNDDQFWFWIKQSEMPYIFLASHNQVGNNEVLRQIPFQPDWLMEVLGVVPLKGEEFELDFDDTAERTARLTSERLLPSGRPVRRVIHVDPRYGLVRQQSLYDANGHLLAKAHLNKHTRDEASGAILPRLIQIEWPQPNQPTLKLNLEIGEIEFNPSSLPPQMWEVPHKQGYQLVNLDTAGKRMNRGQYAEPNHNRFADESMNPSREPLPPLDRERDQFVLPVEGARQDAPAGKIRLNDLSDDAVPRKPAATAGEDSEWWSDPPPSKLLQRTPSSP